MRHPIEILARPGEVTTEEASAVLELLALVLPGADEREDEELLVAARRVIEQLPPDSVLGAVADWWWVASTGSKTCNGGAYRLADAVPAHLAEPMEELRDVQTSATSFEWLRCRRELDALVEELDDHLDLEHYGASKLPNERPVWAWFLDQVDGAVSAVRSRRPSSPVEVDEERYRHELKVNGVVPNSRRGIEMLKRAHDLESYLNRCLELVDVVEPARNVVAVATQDELPTEVSTELGPLGGELLAPLLGESGADAVEERVTALVDAWLASAADGDEVVFARLLFPWFRRTGAPPPEGLGDVLERFGVLDDEIRRLEDAGTDVDAVRIAILDGDLDAAESQVASLRDAAQQQQKADGVAAACEQLEERLRSSGHLDELGGELARVRQLIADGRLDEAVDARRALQSEVDHRSRDELVQRMEVAAAELEQLGAPESVLFDLQRQIESYADGERSPGRDRVAEAEDLVDQQRRDRDNEVARRLAGLRAALGRERSSLEAGAVLELEHALEEIDLSYRSGDLVPALEQLDEVERELELRRPRRWVSDDGVEALARHVEEFCCAELDFDPLDVRRLFVALRTKPFVVLAGLTGSGKSTIARLLAESFGATTANRQFQRVAVRPDWIDQTDVLGYINPTSNRFQPGWLAEVVRRCERNPDRMFFVLLDEMNLAPVEQYLAEVLSAMEEARGGASTVALPLYAHGAEPANAGEWAAELRYPANLFLIGTVNVDETTRPLSDRVIDRANVLQLRVATSDRHHRGARAEVAPLRVSFSDWLGVCEEEPSDAHHEVLVEVAECLQAAGIGVGMRAHVELERFIANADGVIDDEDALDFGILQRVIPKVRGFKRDLAEGLEDLRELLDSVGCRRCTAVLDRWLDDRIADEDFIDGTDARLALVV